MNVQFSKQILQTTITALKKHKQLLSTLGFSKKQIQGKVVKNIFGITYQDAKISQLNDKQLLLFSLKKNMTKYKSINSALMHFLVNLELQFALLNNHNEVSDSHEVNHQKKPLAERKQQNELKAVGFQKQPKEKKQKKRGKRQKQNKAIKQIQKQAESDLLDETHKLQENLQQIQLLKQILHKKILLQYFKTEALGNPAFLLMAT